MTSTRKIWTLGAATVLLLLAIVGCQDDGPTATAPPADDGDPPTPDLAVPAGLSVREIGDTFLTLAWTDTSGLAPDILIQARTASATAWTAAATVPGGIETWEATVTPDSTYLFRIAASDGDARSAWSDSVAATALRAGYWEVAGGVASSDDWGESTFFRFGRANRFAPPGQLTIAGPESWNGGRPYERTWETYFIGLVNVAPVTGDYDLTFERTGRTFTATVAIDASLVLPLPTAQIETLPGRRLHATWSCPGADSFALCWGPRGAAGCFPVGTCTDTVLVALENDPTYWFSVQASASDLAGQPATSSRTWTVDWNE